MAFEIERKFLVGAEFKNMATAVEHIRQGYICSKHGVTVRVRTCNEKGYLTIKGPSPDGGLSRYEFEKEITPAEAEELMKLCEPGLIDKNRYLVPAGKHVFEVDEFFGDNSGLIMAEVELSSPDEPFERPPFLGREVTGDKRFYNSHLRKMPFKLWKDTIPEFREQS